MRTIQKIVVNQKTGKKYFVKDLEEDFHTAAGIISKMDLQSNKVKVESSTGNKFSIFKPSFVDFWENLQRGPQVMIQKDIGIIFSKTGVNKESRVVDAGGGSGSLCLSLANICKEVVVYEINPEHYDVIQKNMKMAGLDNISLKQQNIYDGIDEENLDLITLDLPEPWRAINHADNSLKEGGFLVVYLPNLTQMKILTDVLRRSSLNVLEIIELIERKWKIEDQIMRPEFQMLGHTGFLIFCRKI